jgi:WD40 repeat protein
LLRGQETRLGKELRARFLAFRPDGRQLAFSGNDPVTEDEVRIVDVDSPEVLALFRHPSEIHALDWSSDGRLLAAACNDGNAYVWDVTGQRQQAVLTGHQKSVTEIAFNPAGDLLTTGSVDGITWLWDPIGGRPLVRALGRPLRFRSDGRRLAFAESVQAGVWWAGVWDVADGQSYYRTLHNGRFGNRTTGPQFAGVEDVAYSPDRRLLASASGDGVRLWDISSGREVAFLPIGHTDGVFFHPAGDRLYTCGRTGFRCWPVRANPDGPRGDWRVGPPALLEVPLGFGAAGHRGCCSPDGRLLAVTDPARARILLFDANHPVHPVVLTNCPDVNRLALSPNGTWLATGGPGEAPKIWDTRTAQPISLPDNPASITAGSVAFSSDGQLLARGGLGNTCVWAVGSWEPGAVIPRDSEQGWDASVAFAPDSRLLAVARTNDRVQLFDLQTKKEVATLSAADAPFINNLCFHPDGKQLAVAGPDHTVRVWALRALRSHLRGVGLDWDPPAWSPPPLPDPVARVRVFADTLEAECLPILASAGGPCSVQDMIVWGREKWSNGKQLFCQTEADGFVELAIEAPQAGDYTLAVSLTRAPEYGCVHVTLDGQRIGPEFDPFAEEVKPPTRVPLGQVELPAGSHRLRFTAVGKNPRAAGHHMGIDCLEVQPVFAP